MTNPVNKKKEGDSLYVCKHERRKHLGRFYAQDAFRARQMAAALWGILPRNVHNIQVYREEEPSGNPDTFLQT
ncbi:hypothetical protein Lumi_081 [Xylophilus phage Lumi]|nr:hypothetical protein Lumi_081 [Xylophilus phage Lumi]